MHTVICQPWEESEAGWGTRPDGYSLHVDDDTRRQYIIAYWDKMPTLAPAEYSRPDENAYRVDVDDETYQNLISGEGSRRHFGHPPFRSSQKFEYGPDWVELPSGGGCIMPGLG